VIALLVASGAALGAPTRWWIDVVIQRRWTPLFPWGTFSVNVAGSAMLGAFAASLGEDSSALALVGIGFCGSLTTFSAFAWESQRLATTGARSVAVLNVLGTVSTCLAAAVLGWWLAG
jgi:CrcB protein